MKYDKLLIIVYTHILNTYTCIVYQYICIYGIYDCIYIDTIKYSYKIRTILNKFDFLFSFVCSESVGTDALLVLI